MMRVVPSNELASNLLQMGDFIKIIARAQDYAIFSVMLPGMDEKIRNSYLKQAMEWFDFVIDRNPLFSHEAYMGKIYTLYMQGDLDQAKNVYDQMKNEEKNHPFDHFGILFS